MNEPGTTVAAISTIELSMNMSGISSSRSLLIPFGVLLINIVLLYTTSLSNINKPIHHSLPAQQCVQSTFHHDIQSQNDQFNTLSDPLIIGGLREVTRDKHIHFIGDSTMRDTYFEYANIFQRQPIGQTVDPVLSAKRYTTRHENQLIRVGSMRMSFAWKPFIYDVVNELNNALNKQQIPDLIIVSVGLHDLLYSNSSHIDYSLLLLQSTITNHSTNQHRILFKSAPAILDAQLKGRRLDSKQFRDSQLIVLSSRIQDTVNNANGVYINDHDITSKRELQLNDDGLHSKQQSVITAVSLAAYTHCTIGLLKFQLTAGQLTLIIITLSICATLIYTTIIKQINTNKSVYVPLTQNDDLEAATVSMTHSKSDIDVIHPAHNTNGNDQNNSSNGIDNKASLPVYINKSFDIFAYIDLPDTQATLYAILQLSIVLLIVYALDSDYRITWSIIGDKRYDRDLFIFLCLVILIYAYNTVQCTPSSKILQVQQTSEWKGWMQIMFVLYHYWKAEETYNLIRIFIAAYVWQTGYGYYIKFSRDKPDYSFITLMKSMFRLNFFVTLICITLNRDYMQYYVCPLHTLFTLAVYALMYPGHTQGWNTGIKMSIKFSIGFMILILIWDIPSSGLFDWLFDYSVMRWHNSIYEWKFRSTLDHFTTIIGCMCAWQFHRVEKLLIYIESRGKMIQSLFGVLICSILYIWYHTCYTLDKFSYNAQHAYTSFIPIIGYLLLRNLTSGLRSKYLYAFTYIGAITLETYILQFHIWLSDDAATIIKYTSTYPLLNFVLSSCIYVFLSKVVSDLTGELSNSLISKGITTQQLIYRMIMIACIFVTLYNVSQAILITQL